MEFVARHLEGESRPPRFGRSGPRYPRPADRRRPASGSRASWSFVPWPRLVVTVALCGIAGFTFASVFASKVLVLPVGLALAGPVAVGLVGRRFGLGASITAAASAQAMIAVGALIVLHGASGSPLVALWRGIVNGWAVILSTTVPAPNDPVMRFVPFAVVWIATAVAVELSLRTDAAYAPLIPAALVVIVARLFGSGPSVAEPQAIALIAAALLLGTVAMRSRRATDPDGDTNSSAGPVPRHQVRTPTSAAGVDLSWRRLAVATPVALALAATSIAIAPRIPLISSRKPVLLRNYVIDPITNPNASNPLDDLPGFLVQQPAVRLFSAVTSAKVTFWRQTTLDTYDGAAWSSSARFQAAGSRVGQGAYGSAAGPTVSQSVVRQQITIDSLTGIWTPAAPGATSISVRNGSPSLAVDPASGSFALRSGTVTPGFTYDAVSVVSSPTAAQQTGASLFGAPISLRADAQLGVADHDVAARLSAVASEAMLGASSPWAQLVQLQDYLEGRRSNGAGITFRFDPQSPSGQSLNRVMTLLVDSHTGGTGTPEQFATAFALIARSRGFPTRVAVGFKSSATPQKVSGGWHYGIARGDAYAWPEVYLTGLGWTAFDPTPPAVTDHPDVAPAAPRPTIPPPPPVGPSATSQVQPGCANPLFQQCVKPKSHTGGRSTLWLWLLVGVAAVLALALVPMGGKAVRAALRRRGSPQDRVAGAWAEARDRLLECGVPLRSTMTTGDVVSTVKDSTLGGQPAAVLIPLGQLRNSALYSPVAPSPDDAERAWKLLAGFKRAVTDSGRPLDRVRRSLDPRPLIRSGK